ncbi:MAG TPA: flagellar hook-associated protein FlgL [Chloroflexota bacterium]
MRVTYNMFADTVLRNIMANQERLEELQRQLTSGKRLTKPSDDPVAVSRALGLRSTLASTEQYLRNVDAAVSWLNATDAALARVGDVLQRARELAIQGANDTMGTNERQLIAAEVGQLIENAVQLGNATYGNSYIFAGARTQSKPFDYVAGAVVYNDADPVTATKLLEREVSPGVRVVVNVVGHDPVGGNALFDQVFTALQNLHAALQADDVNAIRSSLGGIDATQDTLLEARASVGARVNRLEAAKDRLTDLQVNLSELRSSLEDVDMVEAISSFATAETVLKAALAAAGRSLPPSLLDFLR